MFKQQAKNYMEDLQRYPPRLWGEGITTQLNTTASFLAFLNHAKVLADLRYTLPKKSESGRTQLAGKMNIHDLDRDKLFSPTQEAPEVVEEEVGDTVKPETEKG